MSTKVPTRIQRRRSKGWRMPAGAIYVGRPSRWGNLVRLGDCAACDFDAGHDDAHVPWTAEQAVEVFGAWAASQPRRDFEPLRGHDLACWCPLDQPCHADVLLDLANQ